MRNFCLLIALSFAYAVLLNGQEKSMYYWAENAETEPSKTQPFFLSDYLKILESTFSIRFFYETELVKGLKVADVNLKKRLGFDYNLKKVLQKTPLTYVKVSDDTYVLIKSKEKGLIHGQISGKSNIPLIGATLKTKEGNKGAISDLDGYYRLELPPGEHQIEISHVGYKPNMRTISIPASDSLQVDFTLKDYPTLEEVVIVGSRFSASSILEKTEPSEIVNQAQIAQRAHLNMGQLLQFSTPSFHSTPQTLSDGSDHIDPATLRGLGPDQLLVLVNGKRRHSSALVNINGTIGRGTVSTDLNAIPLAAVDRIEVLRDGAAAQYGSSAIAGVINIILKRNTRFMDINVSGGFSQKGDGRTFKLNGNYGFDLGDKGGFMNLSLDFEEQEGVNRSGAYTGKIFGDRRDQIPDSVALFYEHTDYSANRVMSIGRAATSNARLFLNAEIPLGEKIQLYWFGGTSYRLGRSAGFYRFPFQERRQAGFYPWGFSPKLHTAIFDKSLTIGIKGGNLPWQVDWSNTLGGNRFDFTVEQSNNASKGLDSPTTAKAGGFAYAENVTNLDISRKLDWKIPLLIGFGSEFRLENYRQIAGEEVSWKNYGATTASGEVKEGGMQMFPGFRPENAANKYRHNLGLYLQGEADLLPRIKLNLAGRYEYYSDFGSNFSWKIGGLFGIMEKMSLRATYNTGFRAPSMPQIYFSTRAFQFVSVGPEQMGFDIASFNNQSNITRQFGIIPLQAEYSRNGSAGLLGQISKKLFISLDAYRIDIRNRIVMTGHFSAEDDPRFASILEPTGVSKAQFFSNAIDTKTHGLDVVLSYEARLKEAELKLSFAGNMSSTHLKRDAENKPVIRSSPLLSGFEDVLFNREEVGRIEVGQPKSKFIFRGELRTRKLEIALNTVRFGSVQYIHPEDGDPANWVFNELTERVEPRDQLFRAKWITNLSLAYHFSNRFSFTLGGDNVFDVYPDPHQHSANISHGLFVYSRRVQQFGVLGAYWFGKLNFKL